MKPDFTCVHTDAAGCIGVDESQHVSRLCLSAVPSVEAPLKLKTPSLNFATRSLPDHNSRPALPPALRQPQLATLWQILFCMSLYGPIRVMNRDCQYFTHNSTWGLSPGNSCQHLLI